MSWPATTAQLADPAASPVAEGELHRRQRRLFQRAFDRALVGSYVPQMERIARTHLGRWLQRAELALCPAIASSPSTFALPLIIGMDEHETTEAEIWASCRAALPSVRRDFLPCRSLCPLPSTAALRQRLCLLRASGAS